MFSGITNKDVSGAMDYCLVFPALPVLDERPPVPGTPQCQVKWRTSPEVGHHEPWNLSGDIKYAYVTNTWIYRQQFSLY